jgi:biotin carboxyl carrier protein
MTNLSQSASFHSLERIAPSNRGIKHLAIWHVENDTEVESGQVIAVVEAMKMEMRVEAHRAGRLKTVARAGSSVVAGEVLGTILY